jgi:hypothetical protein
MAAWGRALGRTDFLGALSIGEATELLKKLFDNRRMLLIVDDVWDAAHAAPFLRARGDGCALLMTTRLAEVARAFTPSGDTMYALPVLAKEDGVRLLAILAPDAVARHPAECRELVDDLVLRQGEIDWRFTTEDARIRLARLYPSFQS